MWFLRAIVTDFVLIHEEVVPCPMHHVEEVGELVCKEAVDIHVLPRVLRTAAT